MSGRLAHADEWIGDAGFRVPDLGGDWRQPLYVPALPVGARVGASPRPWSRRGLACSLGYKTRRSALVFAATLAFVAVSDRLAAFTVSKMSPVIMLAIAAGPAGRAPRRRRLEAGTPARGAPARDAPAGQRALSSAPAGHDLQRVGHREGARRLAVDAARPVVPPPRQLPDGALVRARVGPPGWAWTPMQGLVLAFEMLAPLWFGLARTRTYALVFGLGMHAMIGLCSAPSSGSRS